MSFRDTDEQREFRDTLRRFLEERSPSSEVRRLMATDTGLDEGVWKQMAAELGLQGIAIPERFGGGGFGFAELALALQETGRALLCAPFFSSVALAAPLIERSAGEEQAAELLGAIAGGEIVALAVAEPGRGWSASEVRLEVSLEGEHAVLRGTKSYVIDGHTAHRIVVVARAPGTAGDEGIGFFLVDGDAQELRRTPLQTLDPTRKLARLDFDGVRARPLGDPVEGAPALAHGLDLARVALANEMVGGIERVLEMAADYARTRVQFGRTIGSFQAVKHQCANVLIDLEAARSATGEATRAAAAGDPELPVLASMAKALCSDAYLRAAHTNIQVHGGVGFTWEYDAHLYFRRAKSSALLFGDAAHHRERVARLIGL